MRKLWHHTTALISLTAAPLAAGAILLAAAPAASAATAVHPAGTNWDNVARPAGTHWDNVAGPAAAPRSWVPSG